MIFGMIKRVMNSPIARKTFLRLAAGLAGVSGLMPSAIAAEYPARPVRALVGQAAGSGSDIFSRLIGQWLSDHLHQPFVVENRAGGHRAAGAVARAEPDGYTLLFVDRLNLAAKLGMPRSVDETLAE
jgi:tripartite-type tricarboxylate transporter receptor subunit TctC